jgi:polygalacturonase|eukprot:SAG25_NODE_2258_length_1778_cov_1.484217_2_plen_153_part_00
MTQAGIHNVSVRNVIMNGTGGGIHIKSYVGAGGYVDYHAENITLHGVEYPIKLEQHYGGTKPPCMPHCNSSRRPFFNVSITGMHANGIPRADLGPFLDGTADRDSLVLTVVNSTFKTTKGTQVEWKCSNADVTAHNCEPPPMPGSCGSVFVA